MRNDQTESRIYIEVKVIPNAQKSSIAGWEGKRLKVRINAQPEKGKANDELIAFLSKTLKIPKSSISILKGESGRLKTLIISGISPNEWEAIISQSL